MYVRVHTYEYMKLCMASRMPRREPMMTKVRIFRQFARTRCGRNMYICIYTRVYMYTYVCAHIHVDIWNCAWQV